MTLPPRLESCPGPEVLMLFLEGKLAGASHQTVAEHVKTCSECVFVIGETRQFLQEQEETATEDDPVSPRRRTAGRWWLAAAAVAVIAGVGLWRAVLAHQPMRRMIAAASSASTRPVEGRLSGFPYAPFRAPRAATASPPSEGAALRAVARAVAEEEETRHRAADLHAHGVAELLIGDARAALPLVAGAATSKPSEAQYWSDLAAVRIALADRDHDEGQLRAALADSERALRLSDSYVPALFNRGLARQRLGFHAEAAADFRRAAILEAGSPWAREASERAAQSH